MQKNVKITNSVLILGLVVTLVIISMSYLIFANVTTDSRTYTEEDNNSDVSIEIDEIFDISLASNPTTGYEWDIKEWDYSVLELVDHKFEPPEGENIVGGAGKEVWTFKGLKNGETTLRLIYWQSWEGEESITDEFTLHVTVGTSVRTYTEEDNNSDVSIEIDEIFDISLASNPSTGYKWDIKECDYSVLELVDHKFVYPEDTDDEPIPGTPGQQNWTFKGLKDGETTLRLVYWLSWEGEESIIDEFTLHVTVD